MADDKNSTGSLTRLSAWFQHPFSAGMSMLDWVLFLGLVVAATVLWLRVMHHITPD